MFLWPYLEGQPPDITTEKPPTHLGKTNDLAFVVTDQGRGLSQVIVTLWQNNQEKMRFVRKLPAGSAKTGVDLKIEPAKLGLAQGPALLRIQAWDHSWRGWLKGNTTVKEYELVVDTVPPKISVLSQIIRITRGGSALAVYKTSKDAVEHGVIVGKRCFIGYSPWPQNQQTGLCYFAYLQDEEKDAPIHAWAADKAGNKTKAELKVRLRWKNYRKSDMQLSDRVLGALASRFAAEAPAGKKDPLDVFIWVNEGLRKKNDQRASSAAAKTSPTQMWQGPFVRPRGKPMAGFGDRRTYFYKGKQVTKAVHLGVDLADVAGAPIRAAAKGKVVYAQELGIYGNCVVLDHGQGLSTLYGHLSKLGISEGQEVKQDQELGRSGATGLALGDHLHFSVMVGGYFVNPVEWWDSHWLGDNVLLRFKEAGLAPPTGK